MVTSNSTGTGWACLWDAGGNDTITNAGASGACTINLNAIPIEGGVDPTPYVSHVSGIAGGYMVADGAFIENAIGGSGNDALTGNAVANTLTGNGGADTFVFKTALGGSNIDTITDFTVGSDRVGLSKDIFTVFANASSVASDQLRSGAGITTAADANDYLIYNTSTGGLYYEADGSGSAHAAAQFAWLQNKPSTVDASAFLVL